MDMSWSDNENPLLDHALKEPVSQTIQSKGKQKFGASPETKFAPSNSSRMLGFSQRQTSQSRSRTETQSKCMVGISNQATKVPIIAGRSLSTNRSSTTTASSSITETQATPVHKPGQLDLQVVGRSNEPRNNSAYKRLQPSPPSSTNQFKQQPLMPTTSDSSRMNNTAERTYGKNQYQRKTTAMDPMLTLPLARQPSHLRSEAVVSEFSLRSLNVSENRSTLVENIHNNKRSTRSNSGVAEVIDLVDDDDDDVQVVATALTTEQSASLCADQALEEDIFQLYGSLPGLTMPEKRLAFGKLEERVEVERIFLGVYGFGTDCQRQLYVRVDCAIGQCLLLGLKENADGNVEEDLVRLEEIPFNQIKKIMYSTLEANIHGHDAIVVLSVKATLSLRSVGVGKDCMLCPTLVKNRVETDAGKYILLLMKQPSMNKLLAQMRCTPALVTGKAQILAPLHNADLQDAMMQMEALKCTDPVVLRRDWATRAKEEVEKKSKVERRRQRSARLMGNEVTDPNDSQAYTVYPIEPEVMDAITIFNGDLKRLGPEEYLNDNLIDLKLKHLSRTLLDEKQRSRIHAFSCMFYSRLTANRNPELGHGLVARWTKNFDIFDRDLLLIPINYSYHWSLAVVLYPSALLSKLENLQKGNLKELLTQPISPLQSARKKKSLSPVVDASGAVDLTEMSTQKSRTSPDDEPAGVDAVAKCLYDPEQEQVEVEDAQEDQQEGLEEAAQRDSIKQGTTTTLNKNEACILHMDSLGMHGSRTIGKLLQSYLRYEWDARKKTELSASLATALEEILVADSSLEESKLQKQIDLRRKRVFDNIPIIKCKVPMQSNGYDCGLFVTKFAEMLLQRQPSSTAVDIDNKFATLLPADAFSQRDVDQERANMRILLETIKTERDKLRHSLHEEKRLAAAGETDPDATAAVSSSSDSAEEDGIGGIQTGDMEVAPFNSIDAVETSTAPEQQADNVAAPKVLSKMAISDYDSLMGSGASAPVEAEPMDVVTASETAQTFVTPCKNQNLPVEYHTSKTAIEKGKQHSHLQSRRYIFDTIANGTNLIHKREREDSSSTEGKSKSHRSHREAVELGHSSSETPEEEHGHRNHLSDQVLMKIFQDGDGKHNEYDTNKVMQSHNVYEVLKQQTQQCIAPEVSARTEEEDLGEEVTDEVTSVYQVLSTMHTSSGNSAKRGAPECGMAEGVSISKVNYGGGTARNKLSNTIKQFT